MEDITAIREAANASPLPDDPKLAVQLIELRAAARAAGLILESALKRTESRGAHYREDFPEQNDNDWLGHLQVRQTPAGELNWDFKPLP
jgi:succinate dehydrogenase/fumarate reductase flavoprotein subunit